MECLRHHPISERSASTPDRRRRPGSSPGPAQVLQRSGPGLRRPAPPRFPSRQGSRILGARPRAPHSKSLRLGCARFEAERSRRAALLVRIPGLACCVAGWSPPGGRVGSMLVQPVSIELIDLPFSHLSYVAVKQREQAVM
jgi:hypothetical protein